MNKIDRVIQILRDLGLPAAQQNERSALTLLALAGIRQKDAWRKATQLRLRTVDIMTFVRDEYDKDYAPNSRETIRRQTLHQFEQARLVDRNPDDPTRATNSGKNCYALTDQAVGVLRLAGKKPAYFEAVEAFLAGQGSLRDLYSKRRALHAVALTLPDGSLVELSPGAHNELQVAVIEKMGPYFVPGAQVLYIGDTSQKHVVCNQQKLKKLRIPITSHDKLPDVALYEKKKNWLILVEAVTSHGPVSAKRHSELELMFSKCPASRVYVTAFASRKEFRKHAAEIAWETEVWISSDPEHMIHFNGPKFLGPYEGSDG
jgi:adenine-specific DNA-methyltransferase